MHSEMPGMPNMQLYSREELMQQQAEMEAMQSQHSENDEEEVENISHDELSLWQTIVQMFTNWWNWLKNMLGINSKMMKSAEL